MRVRFVVQGTPQGKGRPKFRRVGEYTQTYTPKNTVIYENLVKLSYVNQVKGNMLEGAIKAQIDAYFPIPKSFSKKKREALYNVITPYQSKPDADNIAKIILDSLNKVAYKDDKQVTLLEVSKYYSDIPRVEVILEEIEDA